MLRRIDWSTPASILEKIIRYEAVHEIRDWDDLRRRIDLPDRRCYAFFHPALVDEPLIFVEVALTREIPNAIAPILSDKREDRRTGAGDDGSVLLDHKLPARPCGRDVRPLPHQAGRGGGRPRTIAHLDVRDAVAGAEFRRVAQTRARQRGLACARRGRSRGACRTRPPRLVARSDFGRHDPRAVVAGRRLVLSARTQPPRPARRRGRPLPPRQRRQARAARLARRYVRARVAAVAWADGELPVRSRLHRAESRSLRAAARGRCRRAR